MDHLEELKKEAREMAEVAKAIYLGEGSVPPGLIAKDGEGHKGMVPIDFSSQLMKRLSTQIASSFLKKVECEWYVFACEGWAVHTKPGTPESDQILEGEIAPSEHPNRKEVITIQAENKYGDTYLLTIEVKDGKIIGEEENVGAHVEGLFSDVFPKAMNPQLEVDSLLRKHNLKVKEDK